MSIKVAVLQSGDQIIAEMKEIVSEDKPIAYLFNKPHKVIINSDVYLTEVKILKHQLKLHCQVGL